MDKRDCCKLQIIKGTLQNDGGLIPFSFLVNVTNDAPQFSVDQLKNRIVTLG
jgi:hypothetical protein